MKKPIDIEVFVRWAYRDELPKEQTQTSFLRPDTFTNPAMAISKVQNLGTTIDEPDIRNRYGLVPDFTAQTSPHEDAVRVYNAVRRLGELDLDLPEDWYPLTDLGDLGKEGPAAVVRAINAVSLADITGRRHLRDVHGPVRLIERAAILGPVDWHAEKPVRKLRAHWNGKARWFIMEKTAEGVEYEADGFDNAKRRPKNGAYQKEYLDPDPIDAAIARADYEIWHACLGALYDDLVGRLDDFDVTPTQRSARPWEEGEAPRPRILVDRTLRQPIIREPRPLAGPPPYRGIVKKEEAA